MILSIMLSAPTANWTDQSFFEYLARNRPDRYALLVSSLAYGKQGRYPVYSRLASTNNPVAFNPRPHDSERIYHLPPGIKCFKAERDHETPLGYRNAPLNLAPDYLLIRDNDGNSSEKTTPQGITYYAGGVGDVNGMLDGLSTLDGFALPALENQPFSSKASFLTLGMTGTTAIGALSANHDGTAIVARKGRAIHCYLVSYLMCYYLVVLVNESFPALAQDNVVDAKLGANCYAHRLGAFLTSKSSKEVLALVVPSLRRAWYAGLSYRSAAKINTLPHAARHLSHYLVKHTVGEDTALKFFAQHIIDTEEK